MSGDNILSDCQNLYQCEKRLREWVRPGDLLGRIPLGAADWLSLGNVIKKVLGGQGVKEGTNLLWANFPTCMAVYLVYTGIRHYRSGELWPAVEENAGVPAANHSWVWGANFLDYIKSMGLPFFEDAQGLRYITPILGHGGIPNYCLEDFFKYVLTPAIEVGGLTAEEILDELSQGSRLRYQVDKPIQRFLIKGGEFALDFFERTLEMARRAATEGIVPSGDELGLPDRITREYSKWLEQAPRKTTIRRDFLSSPVISLDPYGLGVTVTLPSQQLEEIVMTGVNWVIGSGEKVLRIRCKAWQVGDRVRSSMEQVPLPPAENYTISLLVDGKEYRSWNYHSHLPDRPYIAFAINTGKMVRGELLPSEGVWLLLRDGWLVEQSGIAAMNELPPMGKQWRHYTGVALYFDGVREVKLQGPGGIAKTIPVAGLTNRPALVGGNLINSDGPGELTYLGGLPALHIPCGEDEGAAFFDMWRLFIGRENDREKSTVLSARLNELRHHMMRGDRGWLLPLDVPGVLGPRGLGIYRLSVRGPLGSDAVFQITCVHGMDICIQDDNLWPVGKAGYRPAKVAVTAPQNLTIDIKNCALLNKKDHGGKSCYEVMLDSDSITCELSGEGLSRPLTISKILRPLSWGWLGLEESFTLIRDNKCRTLGVNAWRDSEDLQLILVANQDNTVYQVDLALHNSSGQTLQTSTGQLSGQRRLRFGLGRFKDTIVATSSPEYELWLTVKNGINIITEFRVAVLDREWRATKVQVLPEILKGTVNRCMVLWEENDRITNRVIRVWPVWRPWEEPFVVAIPDDNATGMTFDFPQPLEPGIYRFEVCYLEEDLFISDSARPLLPDARASNVCDLRVNTIGWHQYTMTLPHNPLGELERFLIYGGHSNTHNLTAQEDYHIYQYQADDFYALYLTGIALYHEQDLSSLQGLARYLETCIIPANLGPGVEVLSSLLKEGVQVPPVVLVATGWGSVNYGELDQFATGGHQLEDIWQIWPLAGLLLEQVSYSKSMDLALSSGRMVQNLGLQGLELLLGRTDEVPFRWPKGEVCQYSLTECLYRLLRYECICDEVLSRIPREIIGDAHNIKMVCLRSAEELRDMLSLLNFDPRGLLHPDFYSWSLFRWLIDIKNSQREEYLNTWVQDNLGRAEMIMKDLSTGGQKVNQAIIDGLNRRLVDPKGSLPLVNFPYISGVVALAQRQWGRDPSDVGYEMEIVDMAVDLCNIYPGLYQRDLCLFEVLLSILL